MRRLRVVRPGEPLPRLRRPYRDTALVYGVLAALIVVVAALTGGGVLRAAILAGFCFLVATLWSWRRWRTQERIQERGPR